MGKSEAFLGELILNRQIPTYKNYYQSIEAFGRKKARGGAAVHAAQHAEDGGGEGIRKAAVGWL